MSLTYKEFMEKGIDLAPLGIEVRSKQTVYFCTPQEADIFGYAGVDGIHFCFINGFGEMVFAISPCNFNGEYVHPIARSFEDLLSLLVSTSDIAAIEQAWAWNKNMFYKFLKENPTSFEQEQTMRKLQYDLSIPFMEEPFDYIKNLQAEFDYSKIKFTDEYYDAVGAEPAPADEPKKWQVLYDSGYQMAAASDSNAGTEFILNKEFTWGDEVWHIPSIYICSRGFVVDYCVEIELDKVRKYYDKWKHTVNSGCVSKKDMRQLDIENPFVIKASSHFLLNGESVREESGSGLNFTPEWCIPSGVENTEEAIDIIEHYNLDVTKAWAFKRHSFRWKACKPKKIKSLSLRLERFPETIQGIRFKNPSAGDIIAFKHPISGVEHKLTVLEYEPQNLSAKSSANNDFELPAHNTVMVYSIKPELNRTSFTIRDCAKNDEPKHLPKNRHTVQDDFGSFIGIIGGADGPTAIIMSSPNTIRQNAALSALHFEPTSDIEWKMEFHEKMKEDIEIELI